MTQASSPSETSASVPEPAHDGRKPNRLAQETSPYLLQHADNPVNWYPWGDEAFAAARAADKPIFLSIGYSTCYWCHVMERESFEDEATAAYLNEHFIAIKVDREERPDVDDIYMMATQMMTGRGGWPMSVFLDPATLKPFLAGTYFPATPSHGMSSFRQVLEGVTQAWDQSRDKIITQSDAVADAVTQRLESQTQPQLLSGAQVDAAVRGLMRSYDANNGGFGRSPKFPQPVFLELLLGAAQDDSTAQAAVMNTLTHMAMGGMYDQLGGGFHRYSTDGQWIVPHFEKMLYDNGQLLSVYAEAYARTKNPLYAKVIRETVAYVLREMHDPAGGFFSAQDAEVDAREGLSYLWTRPEVEKALTDAGLAGDVDFALSMFGLSRGANFTDPHFPEDGPKNVLVLTDEHVDQFSERLQHVQHAMLDVRNARKQPRLDDKVLTGWNGLMIAGLADAGRVMGEQTWIDASAAATNFVLSTMRGPDGGLLRAYRGGTARVNAFLEDYALLIHGLLALHQATDDSVWLERAATLAQETDTRFFDTQHGGYFETLANQSDLFVRSKSFYDGAMPSGNGMMAVDLVELYKRTGRSEFLQRASDVLRAASQQLAVGSSTCSLSALALHELLTQTGTDEGADATVATNAPKDSGVVSIKAINVARDGDGERFDLVFTIADGYHINAHDPGDSSLIGLMIDPAGTAGTSSRIEVDYPTGEAMSDHDPLGQRVKVHRESVTIPVHVNVAGPIMLDVRFQACSDVACLAPQTIQFEVRPPPTD